jgi:hypothetical protein
MILSTALLAIILLIASNNNDFLLGQAQTLENKNNSSSISTLSGILAA